MNIASPLPSYGPQSRDVTNPIFNEKLQGILAGGNGASFLNIFIPNLIGLLIVSGIVIFIFTMFLGAINWISSGGDKALLEKSKDRITNAIIGLVIMLSIFAILKILESFFGINILTIDIGPLIIR